jgi:hypothetical protein
MTAQIHDGIRTKAERQEQRAVDFTLESPCGCHLTEGQILGIWGRYMAFLGGGRPKEKDRCPCGLMTRARAEARNHKCVKQSKRTNKKEGTK